MVLRLVQGSPGVYIQEQDISGEAIGVATSIGAIVFPSKQGPLVPTRVSNKATFKQLYGTSDLTWGYGHISANAYFDQGNYLQCLRIPGIGAKYAGASITYTAAQPGGQHLNLSVYNSAGTATGFEADGGVEIHHTLLSSNLISGSSVGGTIATNNISVTLSPIGYSTNQATTLANLVTSINAALANLMTLLIAAVPAQATLGQPVATLLDSDYGIIRIVSPENAPLMINLAVANNGTATQLNVYNSNLIDIFAHNPGDWANDIGFNITNIDKGTPQRANLSFSGPLVSGNVVTITLLINNNPVVIGPYTVPGGQSSDQAMANIAALITQAFNVADATHVVVNYPSGFGANFARIINLVAPSPGPAVLALQSSTVTGGAAQPALYFAETLAGIASSETFTVNLYQRGNLKTPISSFKAALTQKLDGYQNQLFLEDVVNLSANRSSLVRVVVNRALVAAGLQIDPTLAAQFATVTFLTGGANGALPTNGQISAGWDTFRDNERYPVNLLINAGFTDPVIQQNMVSVAEARKDCMAILDVPSASQDPNAAYLWRTQQSNINSSYAAIVSPDILFQNTDTDQQFYVPRSGFDAARYVYTDNNFATWFAPAGYDRGRLTQALGFRYTYSKADRDLLDAVQINCGKQAYDGSGRLIFGENTAQVTPSLLSSVAVRRMLLYVENTIAKSVERNLFDQNSEQLGFLIRKRIERFLQPIVNGQGIRRFFVLCNASNNPAPFADAGQLNVSVFIVPLRPVKIILLDTIIMPSSITFNEAIINGIL